MLKKLTDQELFKLIDCYNDFLSSCNKIQMIFDTNIDNSIQSEDLFQLFRNVYLQAKNLYSEMSIITGIRQENYGFVIMFNEKILEIIENEKITIFSLITNFLTLTPEQKIRLKNKLQKNKKE